MTEEMEIQEITEIPDEEQTLTSINIRNTKRERLISKAEIQRKKFLIKLWELFHPRRQFVTLFKVYGFEKLCEDAKELITTIQKRDDPDWQENYLITKSKILKDKLELSGIDEEDLKLINK